MNKKIPTSISKNIDRLGMPQLLKLYTPYKEEFEETTGAGISDEIFASLFINSQLFPNLNTKPPGVLLKDLHFRTNFLLPKATSNLYKKNPVTVNSDYNEENSLFKNEYNEKGWGILKKYINNKSVEEIKKQLWDFEYNVAYTSNTGLNLYKKEQFINKDLNTLGGSIFSSNLTTKIIKENSPIGNIITDKKIASIASCLLGAPAYLVGAAALYTRNIDENTMHDEWKSTSQSWHFDFSHLRFVKVFIFLSNIPTPDYGAHMFVEGSQEENLIYPSKREDFWNCNKLTSGYYQGQVKEEWVKKYYPDSSIKTFCGDEGDVLFENTSGFHRGGLCRAGDREVLQLIFAISNYGHLYPDRQLQIDLKNIYPEYGYLSPVSLEDRELQLNAVLTNKRKNRYLAKFISIFKKIYKGVSIKS